MTQQETKAVEDAAKKLNWLETNAFIQGAQFIDTLRKTSEPKANVGEAGKELVKRIEEILNKRDGNIEGCKALSWLAYKSVSTEIAALMQPDKELLDEMYEALIIARDRIGVSTGYPREIAIAISNYEKQGK